MRSPERKGTVPSLAISVPSNDIRMSPSDRCALAGDVGSTRLMYTPFCPACKCRQQQSYHSLDMHLSRGA